MSEDRHQVLQGLMTKAYDKFTTDLTYDQFVFQLDFDEKVAVLAGNLNYQVENGGFMQWADNGYISQMDALSIVLEQIDTETTNKVAHMLRHVADLTQDDEYQRCDGAWEDFVSGCDHLDTDFYKINQQFLDEVEAFIVKKQAA